MKKHILTSVICLCLILPGCSGSKDGCDEGAGKNEAPKKEYNGKTYDEWAAQLKEKDLKKQLAAAQALGKLGDKRAIPQLTALLKSEDTNMRDVAARALGDIGDKASIPALIAALDEEDEITRNSIIDMLIKLSGQDLGKDKAKWQEWWDANKDK